MLEEKLADLAHGLHERVAHQHRDVGAGEALRLLAEDAQVVVGQRVFGIAERQLEQVEARRFLRQGDVNALLETTPDGCVQHPRDVGGGQHQNTLVVLLSKKKHVHEPKMVLLRTTRGCFKFQLDPARS